MSVACEQLTSPSDEISGSLARGLRYHPQLKIPTTIVPPVAILVVNFFPLAQGTTEHLAHNQAMLENIFPAYSEMEISSWSVAGARGSPRMPLNETKAISPVLMPSSGGCRRNGGASATSTFAFASRWNPPLRRLDGFTHSAHLMILEELACTILRPPAPADDLPASTGTASWRSPMTANKPASFVHEAPAPTITQMLGELASLKIDPFTHTKGV